MKYQAYPDYKDSGVEWFGSVPAPWISTRLKFEALINMGQSPNSDDCNQDGFGLPFLQGNAEFGDRSPSPKQYCDIPRKIATEGQLLFSVRAPVGALNIADQKYGIGRGLCAIASNERIASDFLWWLIPVVKSELNSVSTGSTFEAVSAEQVENVVFFRPSICEQEKIANFLDHETAKIDTLIEKQQQLIKLLKEKRQAVISHAVTKGLNPNAPMRDSGVEWLGEVPKHWIQCTLRRYATFVDGDRGSEYPNENDFKDEGVIFLSSKNIADGMLDLKDVKFISNEKFKALNRGKVLDGDLIVKVRGSTGRIGELAKFEVHEHGYSTAFINAQMMIIRTRVELLSNYLRFVAQSQYWTEQLYVGAYGTAQQQLSNEVFSNLHIVVPPVASSGSKLPHIPDE